MQPHQRIQIAATLVLAVLAAALLSACGGDNNPTSQSSSHEAKASASALRTDAYKNAACMRSHGVPSFPDPTVSANGFTIHITPAISGAPAFKGAMHACAHFLPGSKGNLQIGESAAQQRAHADAMLAFAKCMRQHGFTRFPDPTAQGRLTLAMIDQAGINLREPAVRPAAYACAPLTHGQISKADINQAIANPNATGTQRSSATSAGGG